MSRKGSKIYRILTVLSAAVIFCALLAGCQTQNKLIQPYLLLYAFDAEGQLLKAQMTIADSSRILGRWVYHGGLSGKDVVLAESGIGMTNAAMTTQAMLDRYHPKAVIFSGIAGGIDSSVHIGDITVCRTWHQHDYGYYGKDGFQVSGIGVYDPGTDSVGRTGEYTVDGALLAAAERLASGDVELTKIGDRTPRLIVGGAGVTGNAFIDSREKRLWLSETFHALVTDMESSAVAHVCIVNDIPYIIFRSASDLAGGSGSETADAELEQFFTIAADNSSGVVVKFLNGL